MTQPSGRPGFATNDTAKSQTVSDAINEMLAFTQPYEQSGRTVAIASAYFNLGGWKLIADELKKVGTVRIMLGVEPQRDIDPVVLRPKSVPARRAKKRELDHAAAENEEALETERNLSPFTAKQRTLTKDFLAWLQSHDVEVRRYTDEFLHGKAYVIDNPALGVIAGSSNFTYAGLAKNRELNLGQYDSHIISEVTTWFNDLWDKADPFDLSHFFAQQILPEEPWLIFLRMLWEAYGQQVTADDEAIAADPSMRDLLPFQKDGVARARKILEKHNGVLIADEVGLGKTYVGGALVRDTVRARQRVLIVAPKIIRDSVWKPYIDKRNLAGWVDVVSYDDLIRDDSDGNPTFGLPTGRDPEEFALVLLDEAHTVRNADTRRAQRLVDILKGNPRKRVVLLTATPVNNALGDLHSLLSYFIVHDDEFAEIGIPSLAGHFKAVDRLNPEDLSPEHLFDVLDAVAVRRTRRFVRNHYTGQKIDESGATVVFPEPQVRRVDYDLAPAIAGFFDRFAHALGADRDPDEADPFYAGTIPDDGLSTLDQDRLTLAGYTASRYRVDGEYKPYEVQVAGLLRSGLLKRFESSGYAFIQTCRKMANTLSGLLQLIEDEGLVASGESLRDFMRVDTDDTSVLQDWLDTAEYNDIAEYRLDALRADIRSDIALLTSMADDVESGLKPESDPKLDALAATLVKVLDQTDIDSTKRLSGGESVDGAAAALRDRDDRKVLVFSYFADTIYYLQDNIELILAKDGRLDAYRDRFAFVTGSARKRPGHGALAGTVTQEEAVSGFAPRTGGPVDGNGKPTGDDKFDLLFATDVLAEGVNLQQAHNVVNFDLPWNPMRLVQRHGRVDRIGSQHDYVYLYCVFPDRDMDRLLNLERTLHRKLTKAAKSIGTGKVLPGVDASDDVVFNAKREQIERLADGDNSIFLGTAGSLISGEEFRAMLRGAIENESLARRLEGLPWGIGTGFVTDDRVPGFVFCARILDRAGDPVFRYIPIPPVLVPGASSAAFDINHEPITDDSGIPLVTDETGLVRGNRVDVVTDVLSCLTMASPPDAVRASPHLPEEWVALAFDAWEAAQAEVVQMWNSSLDPAAAGVAVPAVVRNAVRHLNLHGSHRNREDVDLAIKVLSRGQATRITNIVRAVMKDEDLTEKTRTDRLIELVDELGLTAPENREKRYVITASDVHLIAWAAIIPEGQSATDDAGAAPAETSTTEGSPMGALPGSSDELF
jgi:hypothetical protein